MCMHAYLNTFILIFSKLSQGKGVMRSVTRKVVSCVMGLCLLVFILSFHAFKTLHRFHSTCCDLCWRYFILDFVSSFVFKNGTGKKLYFILFELSYLIVLKISFQLLNHKSRMWSTYASKTGSLHGRSNFLAHFMLNYVWRTI